MASSDMQDLIATVDEARSSYVDEALSALLDVVEAMGAGDDPQASAVVTRARERLDRGRRMKYHDKDYVEKVLPDVMLAYQFSGGRTPEEWERIRHLIWDDRHGAAFSEFTYLLEMDLWASAAS